MVVPGLKSTQLDCFIRIWVWDYFLFHFSRPNGRISVYFDLKLGRV